MAWTVRVLPLLTVGLAALLGSACSSDDADLGGNGRQDCQNYNWRAATDGFVICPGVPGCACAAGEVCCADQQGQTLGNARCTALSACPSYAFTCDGPEDCPSDQVCCVYGSPTTGGSECRAAKDCFFSNQEAIMCRSESDCTGLDSCQPGEPGSYFENVVASCRN
ncbi:MAG: hypothetical protein R3B13_00300 [Polyangiaceae bacterium]